LESAPSGLVSQHGVYGSLSQRRVRRSIASRQESYDARIPLEPLAGGSRVRAAQSPGGGTGGYRVSAQVQPHVPGRGEMPRGYSQVDSGRGARRAAGAGVAQGGSRRFSAAANARRCGRRHFSFRRERRLGRGSGGGGLLGGGAAVQIQR